MVKLLRWLWGIVEFRFYGGFVDGFVNDCYKQSINVHSLRRQGNELFATISARDYKRLHRPARSNGGCVRVVKKRGILFLFLRLRRRWGLFAGALAFVVVVNFLSGFVWDIQITGTDKIDRGSVSSFLSDNGFHIGVYWKSTDTDVLENLIMAGFEDCAWVHINRSGTLARVEIKETTGKPEVVDKSGFANIKAKKDGIIVRCDVYEGWKSVNVGDGVTKGDLLISGIYESEAKKQNFFAHARGEVIAQVNESFSITVNRQQSEWVYGEERVFTSVSFFGLKIPLYFGSSQRQGYEYSLKSSYIKLNNKTLPIGMIYKTAKPYTVTTVNLSDRELTSLAESEAKAKIENDYSDFQIISQDTDITLNPENAIVRVKMICLEDIGAESPIKTKK